MAGKRTAPFPIGQRFGRVVVLEGGPPVPGGGYHVICRCDCGIAFQTREVSLKNGHTKSCGCLHRNTQSVRKTGHGKAYTRTYSLWCGMKRRCADTKSRNARLYAERGITVCERWQVFDNFLADMGEAPPGMSLDRIRGDRGYEPGNCRWATAEQQANNTTRNRPITHNGRTLNLFQWAREVSLTPWALGSRLKRGWSVERALTTPLRGRS